ncbi:MAG: type I pantothenate kinase [Hyphomicrobiales bacterium]|nr:type I pantothenate kinase [Hyphomicrobiales bacterium]
MMSSGSSSFYRSFKPGEWEELGVGASPTLSEKDLSRLRGRGETVSLQEVRQVYVPLSRLLRLYIDAASKLHETSDLFLKGRARKTPYIIAIAGSVAVGKSTTARILCELLRRQKPELRVKLVATDGFLLSNAELTARGLMERKGFPQSYDIAGLMDFLVGVKSGRTGIKIPVYSHEAYDILPDRVERIGRPDVLVVEGLNLLQTARRDMSSPFISDFFDFSIFLDAEENVIRRWYIERFLGLCETAFRDEESYFHRYAGLSEAEARKTAGKIWSGINRINLRRNILPTRERARLILCKGADHGIAEIRLRKL